MSRRRRASRSNRRSAQIYGQAQEQGRTPEHEQPLEYKQTPQHVDQQNSSRDSLTLPARWPAAPIEPAWEQDQINPPEPRPQQRTPFVTSVLDLRTVQSLRPIAQLLRRVRGLARSLADSTSPVSKGMRRLQGRGRRLQIAETVQLGEKRFVAILRVDGEQFLIGGSATGVSLLANLAGTPTPATEPVQVVSITDASAATATETPLEPSAFHAVLAAQSHDGARS